MTSGDQVQADSYSICRGLIHTGALTPRVPHKMHAGVAQESVMVRSSAMQKTTGHSNDGVHARPTKLLVHHAVMSAPDTVSASLNPEVPRSMHGAAGADRASSDEHPDPANRFGAAASIVDRLDLRPLHMRTRRPWWRLW